MEMKTCNKCSIDKPDDEFAWKNKAAGIKQQICKQCVRAMSKQNYLDNKDRHVRVCRDATRARVERLREYIASLNLKCEHCGENHPGVLDFHHTDPTVKESSVSVLIGQGCSFARSNERYKNVSFYAAIVTERYIGKNEMKCLRDAIW